MSNKTPNLGLSLVDTSSENNTNFRDWSRSINQECTGESKSAFQKIDDFAGHVYGKNGQIDLLAMAWNKTSNKYTVTINDLGSADAIFLSPFDVASRDALNDINCFVSSEGKVVTFLADKVPSVDIKLHYFISRGK